MTPLRQGLGALPSAKITLCRHPVEWILKRWGNGRHRSACQADSSSVWVSESGELERPSPAVNSGSEPMIARFSLYDFIAVVMPGIFLLWALSTFLGVPVASGVGP